MDKKDPKKYPQRAEPTPEQKANLAEAELAFRNVYPYTQIAHDLIESSSDLRKSPLLNNTISQIQEVRRWAQYIDKDDQVLQSQHGTWAISIIESAEEVVIVAVVTCTYRDALRVAVCLRPVYDVIERERELAHKTVQVGAVLYAAVQKPDIAAGTL